MIDIESLKKNVRYIGIDLDTSSIFEMLRIYFLLKAKFGNKVHVFLSPSGKGFHIKIDESVSVIEDIFIRALYNDDPYRLRYSLKRFYVSRDPNVLDILFDVKTGKERKKLDMDKILAQYKEEVDEILKLIKQECYEEVDSMINELSKKVNIPISELYVGCIAFKSNDVMNEIKKICSDIAMKDEMFKFSIMKSFLPDWDWILLIYADNKDDAWKKITWFVNKTILKNIDKVFWVKRLI